MTTWELLLYICCTGLALAPFAVNVRRTRALAVTIVLVLVILAAALLTWNPREDLQLQKDLPKRVTDREYLSSVSCRSCHPEHYHSWHRTFHRTMTQVATPETVQAPFENEELTSRGRTFRLQRRGDEFWAHMPDLDWEVGQLRQGHDINQISDPPMVDRRVIMITGSHHFQGFWVSAKRGNELWQIPWYYSIEEDRWIPREDAFLNPPQGDRHFKKWNINCIKCHSVAPHPGLNTRDKEFVSQVAELGISCEACHGPAQEHVEFHRNPLNRYRHRFADEPDPTIVNPRRESSKISSQICGRCHIVSMFHNELEFAINGETYRPGMELKRFLRIPSMSDPAYKRSLKETGNRVFWDDGSCAIGGAEYLGLIDSACHKRGELACLSCHSMHESDPKDQLAQHMQTDQACIQCHESFRDRIEEHTHHAPGSSGSRCYNCHMPHTAYALMSAMRSHRIDSPSVLSSIRSGRPNACNLCHLDKTLKWSADHLTDWYGSPPVQMDTDEREIAASVLWLLRGNALQRAVTAWHFGWPEAQQPSGTDWMAPILAETLVDPYSTVRHIGYRSLRQVPRFERFEYDFVAPGQERSEARQRVLDHWLQHSPKMDHKQDHATLIAPDGSSLRQDVERLLQQRDMSPVEIPE